MHRHYSTSTSTDEPSGNNLGGPWPPSRASLDRAAVTCRVPSVDMM